MFKLTQMVYRVNIRVPEPTPRGYRFGQKNNLVKYGDLWFDATEGSGSLWGAAGDMYSTVDDIAREQEMTVPSGMIRQLHPSGSGWIRCD